jgi:aminoglycoside phosphotransferase (APT) family kinase protein
VAPSDDDIAFATRIVGMHGGGADQVTSLPGVVNSVLRVTGRSNDWVVRFPVDRRRPNEFPTEIWVVHQARELGIDTPPVVATGYLDNRPYMVVDYIAPDGKPDAAQMWRWLGRYAATLALAPLDDAPNEIFSRFGRDLPSAWRSHVCYHLDELSERDWLIEDDVYSRQDLARLRALLEPLELADLTFGLAHGDLAPRNLIPRRTPLPPVLIDWGTATTGPVPWTDLQQVYVWAVHDRTISHDALHRFACAAGLPIGDRVTAVLNQMTALRFLDLARWAKDRRPDLYDQYRRSSRHGLRKILDRGDRPTTPSAAAESVPTVDVRDGNHD